MHVNYSPINNREGMHFWQLCGAKPKMISMEGEGEALRVRVRG